VLPPYSGFIQAISILPLDEGAARVLAPLDASLMWLRETISGQASPKRPVERDTSVSGMYLFSAIIARSGLTAARSKGSSFRAAVTTKVMKLSRRKQLVAPKFGNYPQTYP
jgi:hypothetical protein